MKMLLLLASAFFLIGQNVFAQSVEIKDNSNETLIIVNDEGTDKSSITIQNSNSAPGTTTDKLYNLGHSLYWNGSELGNADTFEGWTKSGTIVYLTTDSDSVGIGTVSPLFKLDVTNAIPGGSVEAAVTTNDAGGAIAAYSSTFPPPFAHFADRVSLWSNAFTASGLDLRADGSTSDMRFYTGGFVPSNERMRITTNGSVGIGTTAPDKRFHVKSAGADGGMVIERGGIAQNSRIQFQNEAGTSKAALVYLGTQDGIVFETGGTNERARITNAGRVGIGTTNPGARLHISDDTDDEFALRIDGGGNGEGLGVFVNTTSSGRTILAAGSGPNIGLRVKGNGRVGIGTTSPDFLLHVNGTAGKPGGGSWSVASDARLKDVTHQFTRGLEIIDELNPVYYNYKKDNAMNLPSDEEYIGLIAQEVEKFIPEAVGIYKDGFLSVNNDPIIWTMLNAIKELKAENEKLHKEISEIKKAVGIQ